MLIRVEAMIRSDRSHGPALLQMMLSLHLHVHVPFPDQLVKDEVCIGSR